MKTIIIEDEPLAAQRLSEMIAICDPGIQVLEKLDSVDTSVQWLSQNHHPDIIFMDIQLGDGLSFSIFNKVKIRSPVIFTTAFDQYTLKAFKVNSVDYLLKPVKQAELQQALDKYNTLHPSPGVNGRIIQEMMQMLQKDNFKKRFLVKQGKAFIYIHTEDILVFYSEDGHTFLKTKNGQRHILDYTLDQIEVILDPNYFFRVNRKCIIHIEAIHKIKPYFSGRLSLTLDAVCPENMTVSRDRVPDFKKWLDR